jgi:hypothetical protein
MPNQVDKKESVNNMRMITSLCWKLMPAVSALLTLACPQAGLTQTLPAVAPPAAASSAVHPLWAQVLGEAKSYDCTRFRLTWTLQATVKDRARQIIARYDGQKADAKPAASSPSSWTLLSIDGEKPTAKDIEQAQKRSFNRAPMCYKTITNYADAKFLSETETTATFSLTGLSKSLEAELKDNKMMLAFARAATTVITVKKGANPYVVSIKSIINAPVKAGMATVKQLERIIRFERRADGYLYVVNEETTTNGSAFFIDFTSKSLSSYQDIQRL